MDLHIDWIDLMVLSNDLKPLDLVLLFFFFFYYGSEIMFLLDLLFLWIVVVKPAVL